MESSITPFTYGDQQVRVVTRDGEPWFVARDVCDVLAITNAGNVLAALDEDERSSIHIADGTSGNPNKALVSEAGPSTSPRSGASTLTWSAMSGSRARPLGEACSCTPR